MKIRRIIWILFMLFVTVVSATKQEAEGLACVPEYLKSHIYFDAYDNGKCKSLTGDVKVIVIFVDSDGENWTEQELVQIKNTLKTEQDDILNEAQKYNVPLNLSMVYFQTKVEQSFERNNSRKWVYEVLQNTIKQNDILQNVQVTQNEYRMITQEGYDFETAYNVKEAPIIICKKGYGRAFAVQSFSSNGIEYAILFHEASAFEHELYHLFGAEDYYVHEDIATAVEQCFADSIMYKTGGTVDSLTAFLIGWTKKPSQAALDFLEATIDITKQEYVQAKAEETYSGKGVLQFRNGTYTGEVMRGVATGYGTMVWNDGDVYEGEWLYNKRHGLGTLVFASGAVYEGTWFEGKKQGYGKYTWKSGSWYEGEWANDVQHGHGVYHCSKCGETYEAEWEYDERISDKIQIID